jgi:hypothetical protein
MPSRIGIFGSSGSGKTHWLVKYLCSLGLSQYDQLLYVAPHGTLQQPKLKVLAQKWGPYCHFIEGLDEAKIENLISEGFKATPPYQTMVILDDLMQETSKSKYINSLWISGRHRNVSVCEMRQSIFAGSNRLARVNMEYYVLGKNGSQKDEAARLFAQITHNKRDREMLMTAYHKITNRSPPGFLIIDTVSPEAAELRVRDTDMKTIIPQLSHL